MVCRDQVSGHKAYESVQCYHEKEGRGWRNPSTRQARSPRRPSYAHLVGLELRRARAAGLGGCQLANLGDEGLLFPVVDSIRSTVAILAPQVEGLRMIQARAPIVKDFILIQRTADVPGGIQVIGGEFKVGASFRSGRLKPLYQPDAASTIPFGERTRVPLIDLDSLLQVPDQIGSPRLARNPQATISTLMGPEQGDPDNSRDDQPQAGVPSLELFPVGEGRRRILYHLARAWA